MNTKRKKEHTYKGIKINRNDDGSIKGWNAIAPWFITYEDEKTPLVHGKPLRTALEFGTLKEVREFIDSNPTLIYT